MRLAQIYLFARAVRIAHDRDCRIAHDRDCVRDCVRNPHVCGQSGPWHSVLWAIEQKGGVVHLLLSRGHCIAFWPSIPPLQVAPSFACSVASLSRSPGLQLPGCHSLHCGILADYLLGWGRPSTCSTGHAEFQSTSSPSPHWATGDWVLPAKC